MRIDIEAVSEKKLGYKKVILIIGIIVASIACVYIGIVLPELVKIDRNKEIQSQNSMQQEVANTRTEEEKKEIDLNQKEILSSEKVKKG